MLILHEIMHYNYTLDSNFNMVKQNEPTINIWHMPCQHLKTALFDIVKQKRDKDIARQRTYLGGFGEMDHEMTKDVINSIGPKEQRIYRHIATGVCGMNVKSAT